jgi:membrane protein required for colicin V production
MTASVLNWVDYIILGILFLSILFGLIRGVMRELLALCIWVVGAWAALKFAPQFQPVIVTHIGFQQFSYWIAAGMIFISIWLCGWLLSYLLGAVLHSVGLGLVDRLLGVLFGAVRGVLIVTVLLLFTGYLGYQDEAMHASHFAHRFMPAVHLLERWMPDSMHSAVQALKG